MSRLTDPPQAAWTAARVRAGRRAVPPTVPAGHGRATSAAGGQHDVRRRLPADGVRRRGRAATCWSCCRLRGGIDGLGMVVPHGDPAYYTARPTIAVPKASLVAPGRDVRAAPADDARWSGCGTPASSRRCTPSGCPVPNRSHFSAMEEIEDADPGSSARRGWVNRMIGQDAHRRPTEAVHLARRCCPPMLYGPAPGAGRRPARRHLAGRRRRERLGPAPAHRARPDVGRRQHARAGRRLPVRHPHGRPARPGRRRGLHADARGHLPARLAGRRPLRRAEGHRPADQGRPRHQRGLHRLRLVGHALATTAPPSGATCRA